MSTQALTLYATTIGRKTTMAVSGFIAVGWVFLHMLGQLGAYAGRESYNAYAAFLYNQPALLWGQRIVFGGAVLVHVATALSLWRTNLAARPVGPHGQRYRATNVAALTMRYGGLLLLVFLVYHVLHMTVGLTDHLGYQFERGDAYNNLVRGLQHPLVAGFYILAQVVLGMHLYHGIWSLTQTLGLSHPRYNALREHVGAALTVVIVLGFISVPISVLTGALQPVLPAGR